MSLEHEILEQPRSLQRLLDEGWSHILLVADQLRQQEFEYALLTARGTSDNAGRYAQYVWGAFNRLVVALATPSLFSLYQAPPRLRKALVVGISQSGRSPDLLSVIEEARRQRCLTLAITNAADAPLAQLSDLVVDILAGPEESVAATKTYTGELLAIALLSVALSGETASLSALRKLPEWVEQMLSRRALVRDLAEHYRAMEKCVVLGRGFNYATAFEWSLKLKELCYVAASPYSSADFQHGPVALIEQGYPVMAVVPSGKVYAGMLELLQFLRSKRGADLILMSDQPEVLRIANAAIPLPDDVPEWLTPIVGIVAAQLFCYHLSVARGLDPERPRDLRKVTETH